MTTAIPSEPAAAIVAIGRLKPWLDQVPESVRTQDWKDAKILLDLALDGRGSDLVVDILHSCAVIPCRQPYLLRCDNPKNLVIPKDWCGPCRARKLLGIPPAK